jgi:hypothetical protein
VTMSAEESLVRTKATMKSCWEGNQKKREDFRPGGVVLISAEHLPLTRPSKKLDQEWRGPFKVLKKIGEGAYELDLPPHWKGHRTFNEGRLKAFQPPSFQTQEQLPQRPEPQLVNS